MRLGIIIALVLLLAACGGEPEAAHELVGVWRHDETLFYEFRADGTGRWVVEGEASFDFTWSAVDGGLFMRVYYGSLDEADRHTRFAYEIIVDEDGEFFRAEWVPWMSAGEWSELYERVSGEPGGIVGKWVHESEGEDWLRHMSYEFRADGTGRYHNWQHIKREPPMRPTEWDMNFIWRTDGGYLVMVAFGESEYEYIIDNGRLVIGAHGASLEFTRED